MQRNIRKCIAEYQQKYYPAKKDYFTTGDLYQINDISDDKFDIISNALMAGFIVGYRAAKRDSKNRK